MSFDYKEIDEEGLETLEAITGATKFNKWMYDTIKPYCNGKILEVGSGIGNISEFFIQENKDIVLSDIRNSYLAALNKKYPDQTNFNLDLVHPDFNTIYKEHIGQYDTVFALNVIEHIEDDHLALKNIHSLLKKKGRAVILVPAFQQLYNKIDKELFHFRRYTKSTLDKIFDQNLYSKKKSTYFNFTGIFAWFIGGKLMGDSTVKKEKMKLYNALVPVFKIVDLPMKPFAGLSVIQVGEKK